MPLGRLLGSSSNGFSIHRLIFDRYCQSNVHRIPPPCFSSSRFFCNQAAPDAAALRSGERKNQIGRRVVHVVLLSLTGGVALSALNDLAIFHGCSRKAIENANKNKEFTDALGEPIERGPWHAASLAVGRRRETVSCKFPVNGPKGSATLKIKAIRTGDDGWFSFLRHNDWDILISEALLPETPGQQSRVILINSIPSSDAKSMDAK